MLPLLKKCCFCFKLETGSNIIGWVAIIFQSFLLIIYGYSLVVLNNMSQRATQKNKPAPSRFKVLGIMILIRVVICVFYVVSGICLLIGIMKNNLNCMKFSLIFSAAVLVIGMITFLLFVALSVLKIHRLPAIFTFSPIIGLIIESYLFLVVYSYYKAKRAEATPQVLD